MSVIFLDTCVIVNLIENEITSTFVKSALGGFHTISVGRHTLIECMKNYKNPDELSKVFQYIDSLDPEYTLSAGELFLMEARKIKTQSMFPYFCDSGVKKLISDFCRDPSKYYNAIIVFVEKYKAHVELCKNAWYPQDNKSSIVYRNAFSGAEKISLKKIIQSSSLFEDRIMKIKPTDEVLATLEILFASNSLNLNKANIIHFLENQSEYPALRTYFRSIVLLGDNTITKDTPKKDRFTDAIQFIEASYCTTFVSSEKNLIDHANPNCRGRKYNPDIELIDFHDFLMDLQGR